MLPLLLNPSIFIDGCDALAKGDAKSFKRLVYLTKVTRPCIYVAFVSSEDLIIPEIQVYSAPRH